MEISKRLLGDPPDRSAPCRPDTLTWAARLSEQDIESPDPVVYVETPLRTVTTKRVSWYAGHYLRTIVGARFGLRSGGWRPWTDDWLAEQEYEAMEALENLRQAIERSELLNER